MLNTVAVRISIVSLAAVAAGCAHTMASDPAAKAPQAQTQTPNVGLAATPIQSWGDEDYPANAKAGECYARVYVPPVYRTEEERLLKRAASERIEVVPARYQEMTERVMIKPASTRLEVVPPTYETVEEKVLVRPAGKRIEQVSATYETQTERVLVASGYSTWKRGPAEPGQLTKVDESTGEILCLVEVAPVYKTVTKEVLVTPAYTKEIEVPAEYTTVTKQVLKTPPATREVQVPAEYGMVKVAKLVAAEKEMRTAIPAEYQTVSRQVLVTPAGQEWRQILCATNSTPNKIAEIQTALKGAGFDTGRTDGVITSDTFGAIAAYQKSKNLPVDAGRYINVQTVLALGVSPN